MMQTAKAELIDGPGDGAEMQVPTDASWIQLPTLNPVDYAAGRFYVYRRSIIDDDRFIFDGVRRNE